MNSKKNIEDLKVLYDYDEIIKKTKIIANKINEDYKNSKEITLVCTLNGAVMFFYELAKLITIPLKMEFIRVSSYGNEEKSCGELKYEYFNLDKFKNEDVIIVEDIIDSGLTLYCLKEKISTISKSIKIAVMLNKKIERDFKIVPDYSCFEIDNKFIVGFGLDYCGLYRNINYIGYFE